MDHNVPKRQGTLSKTNYLHVSDTEFDGIAVAD